MPGKFVGSFVLSLPSAPQCPGIQLTVTLCDIASLFRISSVSIIRRDAIVVLPIALIAAWESEKNMIVPGWLMLLVAQCAAVFSANSSH